jgi:transcriptional regulator with XRE-family HTH domain
MHKRAGRASVELRAAQFKRYAEAQGLSTDSAIAERIGLDRTTVFRLFRGDVSPGERIIATVLIAFPDRRFEDFFEVKEAA